MGLTDWIPTYFRTPNRSSEVLTHLHNSDYDLSQRQQAWERWCDRVGHIPRTDETASLQIDLP